MAKAAKYELITQLENSNGFKFYQSVLTRKYTKAHKILIICLGLTIVVLYCKYSAVSYENDQNFSSNFDQHELVTNYTQVLLNTSAFVTENADIHLNSAPTANLTMQTTNSTVQYFINTRHCRIPYLNPFSPELLKVYKAEKDDSCSSEQPLVKAEFRHDLGQYVLHIDENVLQQLKQNRLNDSEEINCCYKEVVRSGSEASADNKVKLLPCSNFHQDFVVPIHINSLIVNCTSVASNKRLFEDGFTFIQNKNQSYRAVVNVKKPSVFLLGIDSLSRMNFRRTMPKTFEFVQQHKWFELQGYNKVGDNTLPNLMVFLTGKNLSTTAQQCDGKLVGGLEKCEFLWNSYKHYNYTTAYAEDLAYMSTFNYLQKGFLHEPTDYYFRPYGLAIEQNLPVRKRAGEKYCLGPRRYGEHIYDFAQQFATRFMQNSGFGLFWTNSFSHSSYSLPGAFDLRMRKYLEDFDALGILSNAIVILYSDHGSRYGTLTSLSDGFMEERLPMFFISLPEWFHKQYADFVKALQINQHRLSTPYDVYVTLRHLLELDKAASQLPHASDLPSSQSLFFEIDENRSCLEAGIPMHFCACVAYKVISNNDKNIKSTADATIVEMNNYIKSLNLSSLCQPIKLNEIVRSELKMDESAHHDIHSYMPSSDVHTYRIKFKVKNKNADFQATAMYNAKTLKISVVIDDISRLDSYAEHSKCIEIKSAKKLCFCS